MWYKVDLMKISGRIASPMYLWTIALLVLLAIIFSISMHRFPLPLMVAVAVAAIADILISKLHHKHRLRIPLSAIITGLIIGSIAPQSAPLLLAAGASLLAILSKAFIKSRRVNIFNPAALGLLVALAAFSMGDEWWAGGSYNIYGIAVPLALVLIISAYQAKRLTASIAFVAATLVIGILVGGIAHASLSIMGSLVLSVNYYLAFVMVAEPKTSPHKLPAQICFGAGIAALAALLSVAGITYPSLIALLIGNAGYAIYKIIPGGKHAHAHAHEEASQHHHHHVALPA